MRVQRSHAIPGLIYNEKPPTPDKRGIFRGSVQLGEGGLSGIEISPYPLRPRINNTNGKPGPAAHDTNIGNVSCRQDVAHGHIQQGTQGTELVRRGQVLALLPLIGRDDELMPDARPSGGFHEKSRGIPFAVRACIHKTGVGIFGQIPAGHKANICRHTGIFQIFYRSGWRQPANNISSGHFDMLPIKQAGK